MSVTHLAGPVVMIKDRVIQRCVVCGEMIRDSKGEQTVLDPDGKTACVATWPEGSLVQFKGKMQRVVPKPANDWVGDTCALLVE